MTDKTLYDQHEEDERLIEMLGIPFQIVHYAVLGLGWWTVFSWVWG